MSAPPAAFAAPVSRSAAAAHSASNRSMIGSAYRASLAVYTHTSQNRATSRKNAMQCGRASTQNDSEPKGAGGTRERATAPPAPSSAP